MASLHGLPSCLGDGKSGLEGFNLLGHRELVDGFHKIDT